MAITDIGMILGIMGRAPATVGGPHGIHLGGTHLGFGTGSLSWSRCSVYSAVWELSQEVEGSVDLVPANMEAQGPKATVYLFLRLVTSAFLFCL